MNFYKSNNLSLYVCILASISLLFSCQSQKFIATGTQKRAISQLIVSEETLMDHHVGLHIEKLNGRVIYSKDAHKSFVPASNMKIYTLYAAMKKLPDQMPFIDYAIRGDSIFIWGTGDPSFLNPFIKNNDIQLDFLKNVPGQLVFSNNHMASEHYGPGWAWDDYNYSFQPERTFFPVHENVVSFELMDKDARLVKAFPGYFTQWLLYYEPTSKKRFKVKRDLWANSYDYAVGVQAEVGDSVAVPLTYDNYFYSKMLSSILERPVVISSVPKSDFDPQEITRIYSVPTDDLLEVMMEDSDNHIAEQLMLGIHYVETDTLSVDRATEEMTEELSSILPDKLEWYDGSGLSRYNHTTPANTVALLHEIYDERGLEYIQKIFPRGGYSGTMKFRFAMQNGNTIFAKSGTLKHHYNVSGYLIDKSGEIYVFSWMNAGLTEKSGEVSGVMSSVLQKIADKDY